MKNTVIRSFLILFAVTLLSSTDNSTPIDGNLLIETDGSFEGGTLSIFEDVSILDEHDIILENQRLYKADRKDSDFNIPQKAIGTDISWIDNNSFIVLTGNSNRYNHGILGDNIEPTGFKLYRNNRLINLFELPDERVFETLRPLVADVVPENPGVEIVLTSSNRQSGSRVELYSLDGLFLGASPSIGRGFRWLHILAVAPFIEKSTQSIALVRTPHINGILELYTWNGSELVKEAQLDNVSTHQIGSNNLNMALVADLDNSPGPELLIPSRDFETLLMIKYIGGKLSVIDRFSLPGSLSTNLYFDKNEPDTIWAGLQNDKIISISE